MFLLVFLCIMMYNNSIVKTQKEEIVSKKIHNKKKIINIVFKILILLVGITASVLFAISARNYVADTKSFTTTKVAMSTTSATSAVNDKVIKNNKTVPASTNLSVHYIDVGQGDSTLIRYKNYSILIDAGKKEYGDTVVSYLEQQGTEKLDLIIATHPDADHIGGMQTVLERVPCDLYVMPQLPSNFNRTKTEASLISALRTMNVKSEYAVNKKEYNFKDLKVTTYMTEEDRANKNDYSVVTKVTYKNSSYLFMGDAGKDVENEFMNKNYNIKADILKVGHHGSFKSTSEDFLLAVKPIVAVISCGKDNEYGHPHNEVLSNLHKNNIKDYRTDIKGNIVISTDGSEYFTTFF